MDRAFFDLLNGLYLTMPDGWNLLSDPRASVIVAAIVIWGAWRAKQPLILVVALAAFAVTDPMCSFVLKPIAARERPCLVVPQAFGPKDASLHVVCGSGFSMPSNHAANTMAIAAATASPPLAIVAVAVGVSRVVTAQHWPSDVLAGWIVGGGIGALLRFLIGKFRAWT